MTSQEGTTPTDTRQLLVTQIEALYGMAALNLADMSHDDSLVPTAGGGNCANWVLGHLVNVHNTIMQLAGADPVWESELLERAGFDPITKPEDAIPWEAMRTAFLDSRERCVAAVEALSAEALADEKPAPFGGVTTRGGLLGFLVLHQVYHAGQLALCRRAAGLPGVIRAPGQPRN